MDTHAHVHKNIIIIFYGISFELGVEQYRDASHACSGCLTRIGSHLYLRMEWGACPAATNILSLNRFLHRVMPRISASNNRSAAPKPTSDKSSHHMWDTCRTLVGCWETTSTAASATSVWGRGGEEMVKLKCKTSEGVKGVSEWVEKSVRGMV